MKSTIRFHGVRPISIVIFIIWWVSKGECDGCSMQYTWVVVVSVSFCDTVNYPRSIFKLHSLTELGPSWEAANCVATKKFPSILWNRKVNYRVQRSPPLTPILGQINPIYTMPSYLKIHFKTVHQPMSWSSQWSLTFWISHQNPIRMPFRHICATCPANLILLDLIKSNIWAH
jgi:hypothetical protein